MIAVVTAKVIVEQRMDPQGYALLSHFQHRSMTHIGVPDRVGVRRDPAAAVPLAASELAALRCILAVLGVDATQRRRSDLLRALRAARALKQPL